MRVLFVLLVLAVAVGGCVHTHPVSVASARDRAEVNARAERGHAVVALRGERGRQVRDLRVGADTTAWTDKKTGEVRSAPTASVSAITLRRDAAGALKGLALGAVIGAAAGLLASTGEQSGFFTLPPELWMTLGAVDGTVIGALAGAIHSERHVYRPARVPSAPAAGGSSGRAAEACGGPPLACAVNSPRRP